MPQVKRHPYFKEMLYILQFECYPPYWITYDDLDAADYGVPQHRVRTILFGVQKKGVRLVVDLPDTLDHDIEVLLDRVESVVSPQMQLTEYLRWMR